MNGVRWPAMYVCMSQNSSMCGLPGGSFALNASCGHRREDDGSVTPNPQSEVLDLTRGEEINELADMYNEMINVKRTERNT